MMHDLQLTNTYCLLAHFLAPNKSPERVSALQTAITDEQIEWGPLVLQANIQMCTPLWYARLKQDDLLQHLPQDLQEYLQVLYESNRERNEELKAGLEELLAAFEKEGIDSILLKGAATFVDDLYGAPGARY
ncbi:MAG: nucleotidyltransferase family protein, partial [Aestuariibacter sp.]|nr:nucleotidyltransferase family protein [Aestuariibacter sp.]